jgi:uncharacterized cupin superfamily protein
MSGNDYTIMRHADAPDFSQGDEAGPFLGYGRPMGARQIALNIRVLAPHAANTPPGEEPSWGHAHKTIEEIYLVLRGEVRVKLNDNVETLREFDAVLIPAGTTRAVRNETDQDAAFAMISRRVEDQRAESDPDGMFWVS